MFTSSDSPSSFASSQVAFSGKRSRSSAPVSPDMNYKEARLPQEGRRSANASVSASPLESMVNSISSLDSFDSQQSISSLHNVNPNDVIQVLLRLGFTKRTQRGSHQNLVSPNTNRVLTVPDHSSSRQTLAPGTYNAILNQIEEILAEEARGRLVISKALIRDWVNDPKGSRQELQAVAKLLQEK